MYLVEKLKKKILLIDADPQGNLSSMFNLDEDNVKGLFVDTPKDIDELVVQTDVKNLDVISSNIELDEVNNLIINQPIRQRVAIINLKDKIDQWEEKYDYIFIDTNPSLNLINQNMLRMSDEIILISDDGKYSLKGIMYMISDQSNLCKAFEITNQIKTIILNKLDRKSASKQMIEFMEEDFQSMVLKNHLPLYATIKNSINQNKSLTYHQTLIRNGNPIGKIVQELITKKVL